MAYNLHTKAMWSDTKRDLAIMFGKWDVQHWSLSCPTKRYDAYINDPADKVVVVAYLHPERGQQELSVDKFDRPMDNLRAAYMTLEAIRMAEVRGVLAVLQDAILALPAPSRPLDEYDILGVRPTADLAAVKAAYRQMAGWAHPDKGGDPVKFREITAAYETLVARLGA